MSTQYFGGAIFAAAAKAAFTSSVGPALLKYAPNVNPNVLINSGVTDLKTAVSAKELPGVLLAYNEAIERVFVSN